MNPPCICVTRIYDNCPDPMHRAAMHNPLVREAIIDNAARLRFLVKVSRRNAARREVRMILDVMLGLAAYRMTEVTL